MIKVVGKAECVNGHKYDVLVIRPEFNGDVLVDGLMGSSADFCDVCDAEVKVENFEWAYVGLDNSAQL